MESLLKQDLDVNTEELDEIVDDLNMTGLMSVDKQQPAFEEFDEQDSSMAASSPNSSSSPRPDHTSDSDHSDSK